MHIIVVGAGIGGLSTALALALAGHKVTILESAAALAEIGAGVQLTPNTTRWLWEWGCGPDILATSALPGSFNVVDGKNDAVLGRVAFKDFEEKYGGPYVVIHRADIHRILHEHALRAGVEVRLNSRVARYFAEEGRLVLVDGTEYAADLVVAVDGINSLARRFLGSDVPTGNAEHGLQASGWAAYRLMADVEAIAENDANRELAKSHQCNCAVGDNCSMMTYQVKGVHNLNIVLPHLDDVDTTHWTQEQYREEIRRLYVAFSPNKKDLLEKAMSNPNYQITNWPVHMVPSLPRWVSTSSKLVVMGDAAHAMPFFLSMGVSMAAEDAAALAECIKLMQGNSGTVSLMEAMKLFEDVRKPRAELVRDASLHAGHVLHVPPGPQREARDAALKNNGGPSTYHKDMSLEEVKALLGECRYGIIDDSIRDWCYRYNVVEDIKQHWHQRFG